MCTSPSYVWVKRGAEWVKVPAPCDLCWSCRENYVSDWVGRCLCEAAMSEVSCTLTLTYAPPKDPKDFSHRIVNPYHFQLFMKRLRKAGHKVRYLCAGEYGDTYDRAHFHVMLFFKEIKESKYPAPELENRKAFAENPAIAKPLSREMPQHGMVHLREWPHGHVKVDWSASERAVRYICEYINPMFSDKKNGWFSPSKKPPLGFEWFAMKAAKNVELSVLPSTFEYMPPGGKPGKKYLMTGATRRDYLNLITRNRADRSRMSEWVRKTFDKLERQEYINSRNDAAFDDDAFRDRQMPIQKQISLLVQQEGLQKIANERFMKALAMEWGFDDVEEFEAFVAAGGCSAHPEYQRGGPLNLSRSEGVGDAPVAARAAHRAAKRPPTGFDRQGNPYWGEPGRDYLGAAFARDESGPQDETERP